MGIIETLYSIIKKQLLDLFGAVGLEQHDPTHLLTSSVT